MTIIYSLNSLIYLCKMKHKFYVYQNLNFMFI